MKTRVFFLAILLACFGNITFAQDATEEGISDEELKRYAVAMDSVERMKATLMAAITDKVENNDLLVNSRYNELTKIIDDEEALKEANATAEEIAFVKEVVQMKDDGAKAIKDQFMTMAKEYITPATYNRVSKALKADPEVKARYKTILEEVSSEDAETEADAN